jgi:cytochrome c
MRQAPRLLALALCLGAGATHAADLGLLKRGCGECHGANTYVKAPAFSTIAARYKNLADAEKQLVDSIQKGSRNRWGKDDMPPDPRISPLDAKKLARWVLQF